MADRGSAPRELVFCHQCENEWYREEHGLQCPRCQSEIVEIIESGNDPRDTHDETDRTPHTNPTSNPLLHHNPWDGEAPDPEDGDISQMQWSGPGGVHFTRISVRSGSSGGPGAANVDPFNALFSTLLGGPPNMRGGTDRTDQRGLTTPFGQYGPPPGFGGPRSPVVEGAPRRGYTTSFTARLYPRDANNAQPQEMPVDDLSGILSSLLQTMQGGVSNSPGGTPNANISPLAIFHQLLNPANARSGDAVYTQEALDRVISQLMEQHSTSTAPGPASESAISALPKVKLDDSKLDSNRKAECSICMDTLSVGDEVTELPCKHWFHGDCVNAWLHEHDTCPQCRRGIMPKDGDGRAPRSPGQVPMNMQAPWGGAYFGGSRSLSRRNTGSSGGDAGADPFSGSRQNPYRIPDSPTAGPSSPRPESSSRRSSTQSQHNRRSEGSGGGGGISGWMGRRFGSGNNR